MMVASQKSVVPHQVFYYLMICKCKKDSCAVTARHNSTAAKGGLCRCASFSVQNSGFLKPHAKSELKTASSQVIISGIT